MKFTWSPNPKWDTSIAESEHGTDFFENSIIRGLLILGILPTLAAFGVLGYFIHPSENLLVLHYNVYFGVDLLGIWWQSFALPVISLILYLAHLLLARRFYRAGERIAAYLLLLSAGFIGFAAFIACVSIAFINY